MVIWGKQLVGSLEWLQSMELSASFYNNVSCRRSIKSNSWQFLLKWIKTPVKLQYNKRQQLERNTGWPAFAVCILMAVRSKGCAFPSEALTDKPESQGQKGRNKWSNKGRQRSCHHVIRSWLDTLRSRSREKQRLQSWSRGDPGHIVKLETERLAIKGRTWCEPSTLHFRCLTMSVEPTTGGTEGLTRTG